MVDEIENEQYIILKDIKPYILSPDEQQKIYDHFWVGWMMACVCFLCFINFIFGFLKKKEKYV